MLLRQLETSRGLELWKDPGGRTLELWWFGSPGEYRAQQSAGRWITWVVESYDKWGRADNSKLWRSLWSKWLKGLSRTRDFFFHLFSDKNWGFSWAAEGISGEAEIKDIEERRSNQWCNWRQYWRITLQKEGSPLSETPGTLTIWINESIYQISGVGKITGYEQGRLGFKSWFCQFVALRSWINQLIPLINYVIMI